MKFDFSYKDFKGRDTGIIRKIDDNWKIFPPREIMRANGLLPNTYYTTIILQNGGIALIPINLDEKEVD